MTNGSMTWPADDFSRVPYKVFTDQDVYEAEQEREAAEHDRIIRDQGSERDDILHADLRARKATRSADPIHARASQHTALRFLDVFGEIEGLH